MINEAVVNQVVTSFVQNQIEQQSFLNISLYDPSIANDLQIFERLISDAINSQKLTSPQCVFGRYQNAFIHGAVLSDNVQIGIHIWPESRLATFSLVSSDPSQNLQAIADNIVTAFNPLKSSYTKTDNSNSSIAGENQISCNLSTTHFLPKDAKLDWVYEYDNAGEQHQYRVKEVIAFGQSEFQHYAVLDTYAFGKTLFLDGYVQSAQKDEHIYHECLIQPAMLAHPDPKKVLVIGAGEGATAREILYHPSVERVVLIDLDEELINVCRDHLDTFHRGGFDHPKVELLFQDGYTYLENCNEQFDVIVIDVVDAIEEGPAQKLYTREFYRFLKDKCLTENGFVVVQSMELNDVDLYDDWHVHREMAQSFPHVCSYATFVPSFWSKWRYTIASDAIDANAITQEYLERVITERNLESRLNYFTGEVFPALRALGKQARRTLQQSLENPDSGDTEADISRHFQDWDLSDFMEYTKGKNL